MQYQSLLLSLTYTNSLSEPMPGRRSISITISDGIHQDMTFTEGDATLAVGRLSGVTLVDEDRDAMVANMTLTLLGVLEEGRELLRVNTSILDPASDGLMAADRIVLTQLNSLQNYQVSYVTISSGFFQISISLILVGLM